ncbi:hypothetical protein DL93DRAFT_1743540 [Clavulina sp. PMI_390]|nr:hypothetical protein DL93DRAFT_1743540 [Clavulina sp. PMI_390]
MSLMTISRTAQPAASVYDAVGPQTDLLASPTTLYNPSGQESVSDNKQSSAPPDTPNGDHPSCGSLELPPVRVPDSATIAWPTIERPAYRHPDEDSIVHTNSDSEAEVTPEERERWARNVQCIEEQSKFTDEYMLARVRERSATQSYAYARTSRSHYSAAMERDSDLSSSEDDMDAESEADDEEAQSDQKFSVGHTNEPPFSTSQNLTADVLGEDDMDAYADGEDTVGHYPRRAAEPRPRPFAESRARSAGTGRQTSSLATKTDSSKPYSRPVQKRNGKAKVGGRAVQPASPTFHLDVTVGLRLAGLDTIREYVTTLHPNPNNRRNQTLQRSTSIDECMFCDIPHPKQLARHTFTTHLAPLLKQLYIDASAIVGVDLWLLIHWMIPILERYYAKAGDAAEKFPQPVSAFNKAKDLFYSKYGDARPSDPLIQYLSLGRELTIFTQYLLIWAELEPPEFKCEYCEKTFSRADPLLRHRRDAKSCQIPEAEKEKELSAFKRKGPNKRSMAT